MYPGQQNMQNGYPPQQMMGMQPQMGMRPPMGMQPMGVQPMMPM